MTTEKGRVPNATFIRQYPIMAPLLRSAFDHFVITSLPVFSSDPLPALCDPVMAANTCLDLETGKCQTEDDGSM